MNCPGSNVLLKQLQLPESDEEDYRRDGIAAHDAGAYALVEKLDAWELVNLDFHNTTVTPEMANAIQQYLDYVRPLMGAKARYHIEQQVGAYVGEVPHPQMYSRLDFSSVQGDLLTIVDYKHGEGIAVDAVDNPQLLYYAYAYLVTMPVENVKRVKLAIVQPRAYHFDGPICEAEELSVEYVLEWGRTVLVPAMERAEVDETLTPGPWCRFCPAKLVCPMLSGMFRAAATANPKAIPNLNNERLGLEWQQREAVRFYLKAVDDEVFRRLNQGDQIEGTKLVPKKAHRVWADGADRLACARFGEEAMEKPEIKSPSQLEKLGTQEAKDFVKEHAYMPQTGLTVAAADDRRAGVKVQKPAEVFAHLTNHTENLTL
jgi:hypothetical protein